MLSETNKGLIENYLDGSLSGSQKRDVEEKLQNDMEFAEELAFEKEVISSFQEVETSYMKTQLRQAVDSGVTAGKNQRRLFYRIAASIVILATISGVFYYFSGIDKVTHETRF